MTNGPRVWIDADGIILDIVKLQCDIHNKILGWNISPEDVTTYNLLDSFNKELLDYDVHNPTFWDSIPFYPGGGSFLYTILSLYDNAYIATSAQAVGFIGSEGRIRFLRNFFKGHDSIPKIEQRIFCVPDKTILFREGDLVIDDSLFEIIAAAEAKSLPVIFNRPWNTSKDSLEEAERLSIKNDVSNFCRISSFNGAYKIIEKFNKGEFRYYDNIELR